MSIYRWDAILLTPYMRKEKTAENDPPPFSSDDQDRAELKR
jgi:hypothetical protein